MKTMFNVIGAGIGTLILGFVIIFFMAALIFCFAGIPVIMFYFLPVWAAAIGTIIWWVIFFGMFQEWRDKQESIGI